MSHEEIGKAFVGFYYQAMQGDRQQLAQIYQDPSMLTFEGKQYGGRAAILEAVQAFPKMQYQPGRIDCQPNNQNGVFVLVDGKVIIEGQSNPLIFSQAFQLLPQPGTSNYWILNDIFRFIYS
eukprot:TRINITY_DN3457_c0_g1_i2.p1 TRINITY_DN3457_c0_g1~~TRINITY_DN3457_c0_g1_i2.p1  ORF type:complete len:122 (+),score=27.59 TRINITY_DN3457_c0_g1_i2:207-572(+)